MAHLVGRGELVGMDLIEERSRRFWERHASDYDQRIAGVERQFLADSRPWVCGRASREVLEVGIGTGLNLLYYGEGVRLTGLERAPGMLDAARRRAESLGRVVTLVSGDAMDLPFEDASFDAVVSTYVLCCVPDERRCLAEMLRVLRPGGDLLLADHVVSTNPVVRLGERMLEAITIPAQGEHFTRRPLAVIEDWGVPIAASRRRTFGALEDVHARKAPASRRA